MPYLTPEQLVEELTTAKRQVAARKASTKDMALLDLATKARDLRRELRTCAADLLSQMMREISLEHFNAEWTDDLDEHLWRMAYKNANLGPLHPNTIAQLKHLSELCGSWFTGPYSRVSLKQWHRIRRRRRRDRKRAEGWPAPI